MSSESPPSVPSSPSDPNVSPDALGVPLRAASELPFTMTPRAASMAKRRLAEAAAESKTPVFGLRLGIRGGGCSGFAYAFDLATKIRPARDLAFDVDGLVVVVDDRSLEHLRGCTLDWEQSLMAYGFRWTNPNAKSSCGCGTSFDT